MRGVVDEERLRASARVLDAEQHDLRIDRTVRNAIEVVEHRARPAVLAERAAGCSPAAGIPCRRRAAPETSIATPLRSRRKSCARARRDTRCASSPVAGALPNGRNAGAECVCDAESSSTGMLSFEATSRRRLSETRLPRSVGHERHPRVAGFEDEHLREQRIVRTVCRPAFPVGVAVHRHEPDGVISTRATPAFSSTADGALRAPAGREERWRHAWHSVLSVVR